MCFRSIKMVFIVFRTLKSSKDIIKNLILIATRLHGKCQLHSTHIMYLLKALGFFV